MWQHFRKPYVHVAQLDRALPPKEGVGRSNRLMDAKKCCK